MVMQNTGVSGLGLVVKFSCKVTKVCMQCYATTHLCLWCELSNEVNIELS